MSISGISSSTNIYQDPLSQIQLVSEDFSGLTTSLASGNLTAAQTAFTTLMQDLGNSGQQTGATSQVSTDLTALGTALNANSGAGDLAAAQSAFATLRRDLQAGGLHHHHHHHHSGSAQNTTATSSTDDLTALGDALNSGDLTAAQKAFATLIQDIGNNGAQNTTATSSTSTQSATNGQSNVTSSLLDALQTANGTSQNGSGSSVTTLLQALSLYGQVGQFNLNPAATGLFSATG
ncbi:MAG: hypothetical protein ABSC55_14425 [Syntrophorhabdales bacterium]|jgi:hypothetical protein